MTEILRPTTAVNSEWEDYAVTLIDEVVTQPSAGSGDTIYCDFKDDDEEQQYGGWEHAVEASIADLYLTVTSITVWMLCGDDGGSDDWIDVRVKSNNAWGPYERITVTGTWASMTWKSVTFVGAWDGAALDSMELGLLCGMSPELKVDVLYLEIDGNNDNECQILRPNSNINLLWDEYDFSYISDNVVAPTTPTGGANEEANQIDGHSAEEQQWTTGNIAAVSGTSLTYIRLYLFKDLAGSGAIDSVDLRLNNVWQGAHDSSGTDGSWDYYQWDVTDSIASGISNMGFSITNAAQGVSDEVRIDAAYLKIFYGSAGGSSSFIIQQLMRWHEEEEPLYDGQY